MRFKDDPKLLCYGVSFNQEVKLLMLNHNVISSNQLADWKDTIGSVHEVDNQLNNYYECLIECDESQAICKRICKEVLV